MASIVDEHLPVKKMRVRPQDVPYMSHEWKNAIRAKRRAKRKYQKDTFINLFIVSPFSGYLLLL